MSLRHGVFRERMLAVVHVDVRSANADVHNFHQHLPVPDFRHGNFPENDLARLCHNLLKHTLSSNYFSNFRICTSESFGSLLYADVT